MKCANACSTLFAAVEPRPKHPLRLFPAIAVSLICGTAGAGQINGTVLEITQSEIPAGTSNMVVITSSTVSAQPACHIAGASRMLIDQRTDHGRAMANLATIARVTGMPVTILGTGLCSVNSQVETAGLLVL